MAIKQQERYVAPNLLNCLVLPGYVEIQVVSEDDGLPLQGVPTRVVLPSGMRQRFTDADGRTFYDWLPPTTIQCTIQVGDAEDPLDESVTTAPASEDADHDDDHDDHEDDDLAAETKTDPLDGVEGSIVVCGALNDSAAKSTQSREFNDDDADADD